MVKTAHTNSLRPPVEIGYLRPARVRTVLGLVALAALLCVVYASLVPLHYTPLPMEQAPAQFRLTPWLNLGIERRADWVANGLIMLPAGFCAAGAVDWRRKKRWGLILASPLIVAALIVVVVGIEFVQLWFPPRVVSQNDLFAGVIGSVSGVALWWLTGRRLLYQLEVFAAADRGLARGVIVMNFAMIGFCLYNLMPLDLIFSSDEVFLKAQANGFTLIPLADFDASFKSLLLLAVAGMRVVPFALLAALRWGQASAIRSGFYWAVALEAVKIPVFSRAVSITDVIAASVGVVVAVGLSPVFWRCLRLLDRAAGWYLAAMCWSGVMLVGFWGRFDHIVRDRDILYARLQGILVVPFARAHSSSEFEAGENLLLKVCIFAGLTFCMAGWVSRLQSRGGRKVASLISILGVIAMGIAIEVGQVFLEPLVPDVTDFILYACGAIVGLAAFRILIPPQTIVLERRSLESACK